MINSRYIKLNNLGPESDQRNELFSGDIEIVKIGNSYFLFDKLTMEYSGPYSNGEIVDLIPQLPNEVNVWPKLMGEGIWAEVGNELSDYKNEVGIVQTIEGSVIARDVDGESRPLISGSKLYQGEIILSDEDASLNIVFSDGSNLSLGEDSEVTIDEFIYDPSVGGGQLALDVGVGIFVFVSGAIAEGNPDGILLNTPTAALGIRGTTVAGRVSSEGLGTTISLLEDTDGGLGQVVVTNEVGSVVLSQANSTTHVISEATSPREPIVLPNKAIGILYQSSFRSTGSNDSAIEVGPGSRDTTVDESNSGYGEKDGEVSSQEEEGGEKENIPREVADLFGSIGQEVQNISQDVEFLGSGGIDDEIQIDDTGVQVFAVDEDFGYRGEGKGPGTDDDFDLAQEAEWEVRDQLYSAIENEADLIVAALSDFTAEPDAIFELVENSAIRLSENSGFTVEGLTTGDLMSSLYQPESSSDLEGDYGPQTDSGKDRESDSEERETEDSQIDDDEEQHQEPTVSEVASFIKDALISDSLSGIDKLNFGGPIAVNIENELEFLLSLIAGENQFGGNQPTVEEEEERRKDDNEFVLSGAEFDVALIISGTSGDDVINGTNAADGVVAGAGDDTITTNQGNDAVLGGLGDDIITLGDGNDRAAGDGDFSFPAGTAVTTLAAGIVSITESAGDGADTIDGGAGDDEILGLGGNDLIFGGTGNDIVIGGSGDDVIDLGDGSNEADGGDGNDIITGGAGNDTVLGRAGDDFLIGNGGDDFLFGGSGDDTLTGGDGNDELDGSDGNDSISGGAGDDRLFSGIGSNSLDGGDGDDDIDVSADSTGTNTVVGGDGDDSISGGGGVDIVDAGPGNDIVDGADGNDTVTGGAGDDTLIGGSGDDSLDGGVGANTISGNDGSDTISSGNGADLILGGDGADIINSGAGNDIIQGGAGADTITLGDGNDTLFFKFDDEALRINENDTIAANSGNVITDFGTGDNQFTFSNSGFLGRELSVGTLPSASFFSISSQYDGTNSGSSSEDAVFIFDSVGSLYFDDNPDAVSRGYTLVATVENTASVASGDIVIVS